MTNENLQVWRVGTVFHSIVGWLCILFFSFGGIMAWLSGQGTVTPWFLLFVLLSAAFLLSGGKVEVSPIGICHITAVGRFQLKWAEITNVAVGDNVFIFEALGKQLVVPPPNFWSGKQKRQAQELLVEQLQAHGITRFVPTTKIGAFSRNCKL